MNVARYRKFIVALAAAFGVAGAAVADGSLSSTETIQTVLAFLGSFGVYQASNEA